MRIFFLFALIALLYSCAAKQGAYWCGDHPCINKAEKEAYFEKTMIVEFREVKKSNKKEQTELNKILEQAKKSEKKRISDEKALKKQAKLSNKNQLKAKKEKLKKEKLYEKNNVKMEELKTESKLKDVKKNKKIEIVKSEQVDINKFTTDKFEDVVKRINEKNSLKPFPDINDTPN